MCLDGMNDERFFLMMRLIGRAIGRWLDEHLWLVLVAGWLSSIGVLLLLALLLRDALWGLFWVHL